MYYTASGIITPVGGRPVYKLREDLLIVRRSKLYYTASGIITPVGGRAVYRLGEDSLNLYTGRLPTGVMIADAV